MLIRCDVCGKKVPFIPTGRVYETDTPGKLATSAERSNIYSELHRDFLRRNDSTRKIEFTVNGALWAGLVVVGVQLRSFPGLHSLGGWGIFLAGVIVGFIHALFWMCPIESSEERNLRNAYRFLQLATDALFNKDQFPEDSRELGRTELLGEHEEGKTGQNGSAQQNGTDPDVSSRSTKLRDWLRRRRCQWFPRDWSWVIAECCITMLLVWGMLSVLKQWSVSDRFIQISIPY